MIKICDPGIKTEYTVADFEWAIAEYVGYPYAVATNTGTAALHLALRRLCVGEKVGIPAVCFRAVWNMVVQTNFVSYQQEKYNVDVMNYGFPAETCHGDILDASEALGGDIPDYYRFVTLSFNWNKPITCGSGGMVLCTYKDDEMKIRFWANQSKMDSTYFVHADEVGYNYRMNDLQATMGMKSLEEWPENFQKKKAIHEKYIVAGLPVVKPPGSFQWNYWITLLSTQRREKVLQAFRENDIETRAMFAPAVHDISEANKYAARQMCLPSSVNLTDEEQEKVIRVVKEALE